MYLQVPDGVSSIIVGKVGAGDAPLALTGGNCSIQGYDADGKDRFWTVTGDRVSAMAFCDVDSDGLKVCSNHLLPPQNLPHEWTWCLLHLPSGFWFILDQ